MLKAIFDNQKKIGICDNCGASIRYEYVTDTGIFGGECVKQRLSLPEWVTLNGKKDAQNFELRNSRINKLYEWFTTHSVPVYYEAKDKSGSFQYHSTKIDIEIAPIVLDKLLSNGYKKTLCNNSGHLKSYFIEKV